MKRLVVLSLLLGLLGLAIPASSQGPGLFVTPDCGTIDSPVTGRTWCFDATARTLKVWNGSSFAAVSASLPLSVTDGGTGQTSAAAGYLKGGSPMTIQGTPIPVADGGTGATTLAGANLVTILDRVTADTTVANTTSETTIYSFSVPGGTLGTNMRLRLVMHGKLTSAGAARTCTWRLKYGATTLFASVSSPITSNPTNSPFVHEFLLSADGATNAQLATLLGHIGNATNDKVDNIFTQRGTAAIDSTAAQTLLISVQFSDGATDSLTMEHAILERL